MGWMGVARGFFLTIQKNSRLFGRSARRRQVCNICNRQDLQQWAIQDSHTPPVSAEKQQVSRAGAVKSAAKTADPDLVAAVAGIMALPLTANEKAEAVRRLLAGKGGST